MEVLQKSFILITGLSASGKTHLAYQLPESLCHVAISTTTRLPRSHELDGLDYFFVDEEEFHQRKSEHRFIEDVEFCSRRYGLEKSHLATNKPYIAHVCEPTGVQTLTDLILESGGTVLTVFVDEVPETICRRFAERWLKHPIDPQYFALRFKTIFACETQWSLPVNYYVQSIDALNQLIDTLSTEMLSGLKSIDSKPMPQRPLVCEIDREDILQTITPYTRYNKHNLRTLTEELLELHRNFVAEGAGALS